MAEFTLTPTQSESFRTVSDVQEDSADDDDDDDEICGADLTDGGTCDRLQSECPYHD